MVVWNVPGALERCASLHRLGARASPPALTYHRSEGILSSVIPRGRDALAPWKPARMVNEHQCTVHRVLPDLI